MALRSATAPDVSYSAKGIEPGKSLIATDPATILDNQDWITQRRVIFDLSLGPVSLFNGAAWTAWRESYVGCGVRAEHVGASSGENPWKCAVLAWQGTAVGASFSLRITDGSNTDTLVVSTNLTSKIWREITCSNCVFDLREPTPRYLKIEALDNGSDNLYLAGHAIMF